MEMYHEYYICDCKFERLFSTLRKNYFSTDLLGFLWARSADYTLAWVNKQQGAIIYTTFIIQHHLYYSL